MLLVVTEVGSLVTDNIITNVLLVLILKWVGKSVTIWRR